MNKKVVTILTCLALVLAGVSFYLWNQVKGKNELAIAKSVMLQPEFADAKFDSRMNGIGKAHAALLKERDRAKGLEETLSSTKGTLEREIKRGKDLDSTILDLEAKLLEAKNKAEEAARKVEAVQAKATQAETKAKDFESELAKAAEEKQKAVEELNGKLELAANAAIAERKELRSYYTKIWNWSAAQGLTNHPLTITPWDKSTKGTGAPQFIRSYLVAEVHRIDPELRFALVKVGGDAGLIHEQIFDVIVGEKTIGRARIGEVINGGVSAITFMPDADISKIVDGSALKLLPLGGSVSR